MKKQKTDIKIFEEHYSAELATFEKKVQVDLAQANIEVQISRHELETASCLYESVKMKNEELEVHLESRNKEFADWRKAVGKDIFKDMSIHEHVNF